MCLIQLGSLAYYFPNDESPAIDGLTNIQALMAIGSDHSSGWHFFGGDFSEFYFSDSVRFARLSLVLAPHQPRLTFYEMAACGCPDMDVSFDDNLSKIKLPILYVSAQGGAGLGNDYTASLTKSKDVTLINVEVSGYPTETNFGHADLWMGYDASDLVWEPLRQWLLNH